MSPSRSSARGFSLIEAMAAMLVFVIGIVGVMQMNVLASQQNNLANRHMVASKIARDLADAFERLPYNHPIFRRPTALDPTTPAFTDITNTDGLWTMDEALALTGSRPLTSAAAAILGSEGSGDVYEVAWRSTAVPNPDPEAAGAMDSLRIVIMVRYFTPLRYGDQGTQYEGTGVNRRGFRQINVWTVKYDPAFVTLDPQAVLEI